MHQVKLLIVALLVMTLSACEVIGDIFEAGIWVGVIAVVALVALIGFIIAKLR